MFHENYSMGSVTITEAIKAVGNGRGLIFPLVVHERKVRSQEMALVYGFFFRDDDGRIFDLTTVRTGFLKTLKDANGAMNLLKEIYPDASAFTLPALIDKNVVRRRELDNIQIFEPHFS